jgi:dihydrodipicolinate synthase/N-acetylneuraminate lyase
MEVCSTLYIVLIGALLTISHTVVLAGTNGEAVTLSASEKSQLVKTTRELAIQLGRPELTVILGCGGGSTRQVIEETRLAKDAGADFALVLVPSYFHFAMNEDAIVAFFEEVRISLHLTIISKYVADLVSSWQTQAPSRC